MAIHFPAEGRNYLIGAAVGTTPRVTDWYIVLLEGDYTPQDDDKASNIVARATEITAYSEGTRQVLVRSPVVNGTISNAGNVAKVTLTANKTLRCVALVSSATKGSGTGILLAVERLTAPRAYAAGDVISLPIEIAAENV